MQISGGSAEGGWDSEPNDCQIMIMVVIFEAHVVRSLREGRRSVLGALIVPALFYAPVLPVSLSGHAVLSTAMRNCLFRFCQPALPPLYIAVLLSSLFLCRLVVSSPHSAVGGVVLSVGRLLIDSGLGTTDASTASADWTPGATHVKQARGRHIRPTATATQS